MSSDWNQNGRIVGTSWSLDVPKTKPGVRMAGAVLVRARGGLLEFWKATKILGITIVEGATENTPLPHAFVAIPHGASAMDVSPHALCGLPLEIVLPHKPFDLETVPACNNCKRILRRWIAEVDVRAHA